MPTKPLNHILRAQGCPDASDVTPAEALDVASNTAKLGLTGLIEGQRVRITGEGNRPEQYVGGTIANVENWVVLRNTVRIFVDFNIQAGANLFINGVPIVSNSTTDCGWVNPLSIPVYATSHSGASGNLTLAVTPFDEPTYVIPVAGNPISLNAVSFTLPALPDRCPGILITGLTILN